MHQFLEKYGLIFSYTLIILQVAIDLQSPTSHAAGTFYIFAVAISVFASKKQTVFLGAISIMLIILGGGWEHPDYPASYPHLVFWNRLGSVEELVFIAVVTLWMQGIVKAKEFSEMRVIEASEALMTSKKLYEDALNVSGVGIFDHDLISGVLKWDDNVLRIWGMERRDFTERYEDWAGSLLEEDMEASTKRYERSLYNPSIPYENEFRITRKSDGAVRSIRCRGAFFRDNDGNPKRAIGAVWDVTEIEEANYLAEKERARFRELLENLRGAYWVWDNKERGPTFVSKEYEDIFDRSISPMFEGTQIGQDDWQQPVHPDDVELAAKELDLQDRDTPVDVTYRIIVDGRTKWIRSRGFPVMERGVPVRFVGVTEDVTEAQRAKLRLEDMNEDLQQFAFAASHDLQEPIRTIGAYATLLEMECPEDTPEEMKGYLKKIINNAERMSELIKNILQFSRAGSQPINPKWVNLGDIIENIKRDMPSAEDSIKTENLCIIYVTESLVYQVFKNLVSNSVKAGSTEIKITQSDSEKYYNVSVKDDGSGIPDRFKPNVFDPFYRIRAGGSGIGLAVCKRIVERSGGRIWLESEEGVGTTFHIEVPKNEQDEPS